MNKHLLVSLTAAVILAAVLCTAGCIEAPSDPIVGNWVSETDSSVTYAVFENGGAGFFAKTAEGAAEMDAAPFDWKADGKSAYTLAFADGRAVTAVLDAEHGLMTIGGVEYQKYPSELSGRVLGMLVEGWKYESVSYNSSLKSRARVTPD